MVKLPRALDLEGGETGIRAKVYVVGIDALNLSATLLHKLT